MRRVFVFALIISMSQTPILVAAQNQEQSSGTKQRIELMGTGASVDMTLASGSKLRGTIGAIEDDRFEVISPIPTAPPRWVAFEEVSELRLATSTFRSHGAPDAEGVRRVVAGLGIGRHVAVQDVSGATFRGDLLGLEPDHFVLRLDQGDQPQPIGYDSVKKLGPNMSTTWKFTLVGIAAAASAVFLVSLANGDPYRQGRGGDLNR